MWKDSIRNIVVIFQPNILRIVGFYVRHSAMEVKNNHAHVTRQKILKMLGWKITTIFLMESSHILLPPPYKNKFRVEGI